MSRLSYWVPFLGLPSFQQSWKWTGDVRKNRGSQQTPFCQPPREDIRRAIASKKGVCEAKVSHQDQPWSTPMVLNQHQGEDTRLFFSFLPIGGLEPGGFEG